MDTNNKHYAGICGFRTQEKAIKGQETHLSRAARQLLKTVLTIVGLIFLAQLFKVYFHSEVFGGVFETTAVMTFLISPILIFAKRMSPEKEKEFLKNHPCNTEDSSDMRPMANVDGTPMVGMVDANGNPYGVSYKISFKR